MVEEQGTEKEGEQGTHSNKDKQKVFIIQKGRTSFVCLLLLTKTTAEIFPQKASWPVNYSQINTT